MIDVDLEAETFLLEIEIHEGEATGNIDPALYNLWYSLKLQEYSGEQLLSACRRHIENLAVTTTKKQKLARDFHLGRLLQISDEIKRRTGE